MGMGLGRTVDVEPVPAAGPDATPASMASLAAPDVRGRVLRFRFPLLVVVAVGLVAAGQLAEDVADSPTLEMISSPVAIRRWTVIAVALYMLVISHVLDRTVQRSLLSLKRALQTDDARFEEYAFRMRQAEIATEGLFLAASALLVVLLFVVVRSDLPVASGASLLARPLYLPDGPSALFVLAGYTVVGWAGLRLVYVTTRLARVLGEMSRQPLDIDVFDTTNLLPFGNIALAVSLAPVGIIVILLAGLGQPSTPLGWGVLILAAVASVLALLLPIRGTHSQMSKAKHAVLARLNARIRQVYDESIGTNAIEATELIRLTNRTNTLIPLRKTVQEMTTWPFRDTLALGRAVVIASAPVIYAALIELIKIVWFTPPKP